MEILIEAIKVKATITENRQRLRWKIQSVRDKTLTVAKTILFLLSTAVV